MSDERKLIAEALTHDAAIRADEPECDCLGRSDDGTCAQVLHRRQLSAAAEWQRNHLRELLDGYAAALDEVVALQAERARLVRVILEPVLTPEQLERVMK